MKRNFACIFFFCILASQTIIAMESGVKQPAKYVDKTERMSWWTAGRFGLFIHWGLYSMPARHEWVKSREKMTDSIYDRYMEYFNPD